MNMEHINAMSDEFLQADNLNKQQIRELQLQRLREAVDRARRAPWYDRTLGHTGIEAADICSVDDVCKLPLTTKDDLRQAMPYGFLAVPLDDVVRMHYSSGTTGVATGVCHTHNDVRWWSECVARGLRAAGVTRSDVFQNMMGYGLFTGGLGFHYASELIGCMTIPASAGNTQRQVQLMRQFGTTVLHILPSYAVRVANYCIENGLDPANDLSIRIVFVGGEPHSEHLRARIEQLFGCKSYNCYGLSEMAGPGVAMECPAQHGLHVREDHYLAEVLDPVTLEPVEPGERGELVLTSLRREAMPLLRYRTRDLTRLIPEPCPCGNSHCRIERIQGRTDDMLIVKGVNIYPQQVEYVLMQMPEVGNNYLILLENPDNTDDMVVQVELSPTIGVDDMRALRRIERQLVDALHAELLVTPTVKLLQPNSLPAAEGKAVRVIDNRQ
jgi:phenylacetate-CoA ligase